MEWHKRVPRDPHKNLAFRRHILNAALESKQVRQAVIEACKQDVLFYINTFVLQFNPKKPPSRRVGPFITWPCQEEAVIARPETHDGKRGILWCYENGKDAVIEKSREMGASWLFLIVQDWLSIFFQYTQTLNISRSRDAVDCKSPDSLFWKIRFMHKHLPEWLKGPLVEQDLYFEYEKSKSIITGEASTGRAGVGGRAAIIFVDEFSQIREATEVRQRTASTADVRFFNGTHLGVGTEFYKLTQSPEFVKIQLHWSQHPEKNQGMYRYNRLTNQIDFLDPTYEYPRDYLFITDGSPTGGPFPGLRSPWYDAKCASIGSARGVAMELDINASGAATQVFDPILIYELSLKCQKPWWEGDVLTHSDVNVPLRLTKKIGGPLKLWINPKPDGTFPVAKYAVGGDIALGLGATPSCLSFVNVRSGVKVAEYTNAHIAPIDFAAIAVFLCKMFKDEDGSGALFCWEMQGPGETFGREVIRLGYRTIYYRVNEQKLWPTSNPDTPGWYPNQSSRNVLIAEYEAALRTGDFVNYSEPALKECLAFKYDDMGNVVHSGESAGDDPIKARINHSDHVIADALAYKMAKCGLWTQPKERQIEEIKPNSLAGRRQMADNLRRELEWV